MSGAPRAEIYLVSGGEDVGKLGFFTDKNVSEPLHEGSHDPVSGGRCCAGNGHGENVEELTWLILGANEEGDGRQYLQLGSNSCTGVLSHDGTHTQRMIVTEGEDCALYQD